MSEEDINFFFSFPDLELAEITLFNENILSCQNFHVCEKKSCEVFVDKK